MHKTGMLIKFSKQIANSFARITKDFLEVIRGQFKTQSNIWVGAFSVKS